MIGLAAGFLPALPWPDYLALDAFASDAEAKAARPPRKGSARRARVARRCRAADPPPLRPAGRSPSCLSEQLGRTRSAASGNVPEC